MTSHQAPHPAEAKCPVSHSTSQAQPDSFDHHSPALTEPKIWDEYDALRAQCPVMHSGAHGGYWVVTGYSAVKTALRDPDTFSSANGIRIPSVGEGRSIPIDFDPPQHTEYRALMTQAITPDKVRTMQPFLRTLIEDLLTDLAGRGGGDFVSSVALPLPLRVLTEVVGFSLDTVGRLRELTERQWEVIAEVSLDEARRELRVVMEEEIARHRAEQPDDYLTWLLKARVFDRPINDDEVARILLTLAIAGHETTANASASLVYTLATNMGLQEKLRADPSRAGDYVEEILRFRAPAHGFGRTTTREVELAGVTIQQGESVLLSYAAGNRDEAQFSDPGVFDPERGGKGHLAFGWGIHQCLGSALARSELKILLETLCTLPPFHLAEEARFGALEGGIHFGPSRLPIVFA